MGSLALGLELLVWLGILAWGFLVWLSFLNVCFGWSIWWWLFLSQMRLQCSSNSVGKLVKFASAFADLKRDRISLRSTMQILHCSVRTDFMHLTPSPCQRMVGVIMLFIIWRTWLLLVQSRQILEKCLAKASAPAYPPLLYQLCPNFFLPVSITFHTSLMCSFVLVLKYFYEMLARTTIYTTIEATIEAS